MKKPREAGVFWKRIEPDGCQSLSADFFSTFISFRIVFISLLSFFMMNISCLSLVLNSVGISPSGKA